MPLTRRPCPLSAEYAVNNAVRHRPARGRSPVGHADLGVDVLDVVFGGPRRDEQLPGDLAGGTSGRDQAQHVDLSAGGPPRPGAAGPRRRVTTGDVDLSAGVAGG